MTAMRLDAQSSSLASKMALARLSEDLMTNPAAREEFIADPVTWVRMTYKVEPSESDQKFLQGYQELMAGGSCCAVGCGCDGNIGAHRA
jgi:hypothetical protein